MKKSQSIPPSPHESDVTVSRLAERVGTSPSAVSKAVNHCPGLGSDLRERILEAAESEGLSGRRTAWDVYVILPDVPAYFWHPLLQCLDRCMNAHGLSVRYNVYTRLGDKDTVERYLREAEKLNPAALIVAARYSGIEASLERIAERSAVFSLVEAVRVPAAFFVGSDHFADGRLLAENLLAEWPHAGRVLIFSIGPSDDRLRGFVDVIRIADCPVIYLTGNESAAEPARMIDAAHRHAPLDAVVCLNGSTPLVCMALKKCRADIPCYGFEAPPIDNRYPLPVGEVVQDLARMAAVLTEQANRYVRHCQCPDSRYTMIPSTYVRRCRPDRPDTEILSAETADSPMEK